MDINEFFNRIGQEQNSAIVRFGSGPPDGACDRMSSPMLPAERWAHLPLHGPPDTLKTRAHPWLSVPEHPPLPYVPWVRLKVQGPRDAATTEGPIERLPNILPSVHGRRWPDILGAESSLFGASITLSRACGAVMAHAQMLSKIRKQSAYITLGLTQHSLRPIAELRKHPEMALLAMSIPCRVGGPDFPQSNRPRPRYLGSRKTHVVSPGDPASVSFAPPSEGRLLSKSR